MLSIRIFCIYFLVFCNYFPIECDQRIKVTVADNLAPRMLKSNSSEDVTYSKETDFPYNMEVPPEKDKLIKKVKIPFGYPTSLGFLFIFGTIFLGVIVRATMLSTSMCVPYRIVMLLLGALAGFCANKYEPTQPIVAVCYQDIDVLLLAYLPILVFNTSYNVDVHAFWKSFPQILIVSIPGAILTAFIVGFMALYVIEQTWNFKTALLLGIICSPIYPMEVVKQLKEMTHGKNISVLLLGEGLIGDVTTVISFTAVFGMLSFALSDAAQVAMFLTRMVGGGIVLGYISGKITGTLLSITYNDTLCAVAVTLSGAYVTYYIGEKYLYVSGLLATVITGLMISKIKSIVASDVEQVIYNFWNILSHIANTLIFTMVGVVIFEKVSSVVTISQIALVFVTYSTVYCARLLVYICLTPVLRRVGYGITWQHSIACVWGGLRGPLSLCLALNILETIGVADAGEIFVIQVTGLVCLSLLINAISMTRVLKVLGLAEISLAKKANMTNCVKRIMLTRDRFISMLKMDKFLADANWDLVEAGTNIKHPYQIQFSNREEESEDDTYMGYRYTTCPDCDREIPNEPTKKEFNEMMREANQRVLKAMKISYWRQYEHGKISRDGVRTLVQAVEVAADSDDGKINLEQLGTLWKPKPHAIWIRRKLINMISANTGTSQIPRGRCRLRCYRIATNLWFEVFIYLAILTNTPVILCEVFMKPPIPWRGVQAIKILNFLFYIIYFLEMTLKVFAFGVCGYVNSNWNKLDFFIILMATGDLVLDIIDACTSWNKWGDTNSNFLTATKLLRMLRFLRLFRLARVSVPKVMAYIDKLVDIQLAFGYDVGKGFVTGEQEVSNLLPQLVDNKQIQETLIQKLENDRLAVTRQLGLLQRDRPWTAITVKTRQATASTLHIMLLDAMQLKEEGFLDEMEYRLLVNAIQDKVQLCRHKGSLVAPCSPETQLRAVSWLQGNTRVADFFIENSEIINRNVGDVLISRGDEPKGLYILVSGLLEATYTPPDVQLDEAIPNYDFITDLKFNESSHDYIVSGNAIGVLGVLTSRPYNYTVRCDSAVQAYYITMTTMREAFSLSQHPILGLEAAMWREIGIKLALVVLPQMPAYHSWSVERLSMRLEHAFVPCLKAFKIFAVNELMEDVMLLDGICQDMHTREVFQPPCYIPRTAYRLIFPASSQLVVSPSCPETKLLIIPAKDADELYIMEDELHDMQCELVSNASSRCLYHKVIRKLSNESRTQGLGRRGRGKRRRGAPKRVNYRESVWTVPVISSALSSEETTKYYKPNAPDEITNEKMLPNTSRRDNNDARERRNDQPDSSPSSSVTGHQSLRFHEAERPSEREIYNTILTKAKKDDKRRMD